jgi:hypothetical protein
MVAFYTVECMLYPDINIFKSRLLFEVMLEAEVITSTSNPVLKWTVYTNSHRLKTPGIPAWDELQEGATGSISVPHL